MTGTGEKHEEILNIYDDNGAVSGTLGRRAAKARGEILGVVHALVVNGAGEVLLQQRPQGLENGTRWDKTVGGHVGAGESFADTIVRESREELFDDAEGGPVVLAADDAAFTALVAAGVASGSVVLKHAGVQLGLRDVRVVAGGFRNQAYHVGIFIGRTDLTRAAFRPQASEIADLRFHEAAAVDAMLLAGTLAPNMAFLWLAYGRRALRLAGDGR